MPLNQRARILIVEDEALIAMLVQDALIDAGYDPVGPAASLAKALTLAETAALSAAVLDVNVDGEPVFPVAEVLQRRAIPYVFVTGYQRSELPPMHREAPTLEKPFDAEMIVDVLGSLVSVAA